MGEIAEAMVWAEMMGMDPESPEAFLEYAESNEPTDPNWLAWDAKQLLSQLREHGEGEIEPWELLEALFPDMDNGQSKAVAAGLEILASFYKEDE